MEIDVAYNRLQAHHKQSFDCISNALKIDEDAGGLVGKRKAVEQYKKGIRELERGIAIDTNSISPEKAERAESLRMKMNRNLEMAKERLEALETEMTKMRNSKPQLSSQTFRAPLRNESPRINGVTVPSRDPRTLRNESPRINGVTVPSRGPRTRGAAASKSPARKNQALPKGSSSNSSAAASKADIRTKASNMKGLDPNMCNTILDQILDLDSSTTFEDISGLETCKQALKEAVILPALNPDMFTGLREPVHGILLFGSPGNGKTMLAKAVSKEANANFFNISASSLTSKWVGEAEKLVKTLFAMARNIQPSIIFIDEIDSILCERSEKENEVSRRLKTEFLLQFDGVGTDSSDRLLVMGATNRPFELDEAVLRRFPKRICIPLPDESSRVVILTKLLQRNAPTIPLSQSEIREIAWKTKGYSASDLTHLAKEAAMGPIRDHSLDTLKKLKTNQLRPIMSRDFDDALKKIRASCNPQHMEKLNEFNSKFGDLS